MFEEGGEGGGHAMNLLPAGFFKKN